MTELNTLIDGDQIAETLERLWAQARAATTYSELRKLVRVRQGLAPIGFEAPHPFTPLRVALASDATTTYLAPILSLLLESRGVVASLYEAPYGPIEAQLLRADSGLAEFQPQLLVLMQTPLAITDWPLDTVSTDDAVRFAEARVARLISVCRAAHERFGCEIVLDNWHALSARPHGSGGRRMAGDRNAVMRCMNALLDNQAPTCVHIHDVEGLAALHGLQRWIDWRFWYHARQPIAFDSLGPYVSSLSATVASVYRPPVKCAVVDLDNTLWGGVIGDDGIAGIRIRTGDAQGEAFQAFQRHLLRLKQRGILLAVCSKNDVDNARAPFRELPDMVLKLDDFVSFKANWEPKPLNIQAIAKELNIGLESLSFIDDNPAEREHVRTTLPMVRVIDIPDDPAEYGAALDRSGWFEVSAVTAEDVERTDQYLANTRRGEEAASVGDYATYLVTLEQHAQIREFEPAQLDRITQLVNKTNQFNLTTQRVTRTEMEGLVGRADVLTATVRLSDRFGDSGLIAVLHGSIEGSSLRINQWLMSCRVFNRGLEEMLMNHVVEVARARGLREIVGEYQPTKKNTLVRDLYPRLGFRPQPPLDGVFAGAEFWVLATAEYQPFEHTIALEVEQYS